MQIVPHPGRTVLFALLLLGTTGLAHAADWSLTGNGGITASDFLGTTGAEPLLLKTDGKEALRILPNGDVGIGTTTPASRLDVKGTLRATGLDLPTGAGAGLVLTSNAAGAASWAAAKPGPQGPAGKTGAAGPAGEKGATGAAGKTGARGPAGAVTLPYATTVSYNDAALQVVNTGQATAIEGRVTNGGAGLWGVDQTPTTGGTGYGVYGYSINGYGMYAYSTATGVYGESVSNVGVEGVLDNGSDQYPGGTKGLAAVKATDKSPSGNDTYGVYATSSGTAVYGASTRQALVGVATYTGTGVSGTATQGFAAEFQGGLSGQNTCYYDGGPAGWTCSSLSNSRTQQRRSDLGDLLERLGKLPIDTYQTSSARPTRYIGPTAEDFHTAFELGDSDTMIASGNLAGVALAAAKGLYERAQRDEAEIARLHQRLDTQQAASDKQISALEARFTALEQQLAERAAPQQVATAADDRPAAR